MNPDAEINELAIPTSAGAKKRAAIIQNAEPSAAWTTELSIRYIELRSR